MTMGNPRKFFRILICLSLVLPQTAEAVAYQKCVGALYASPPSFLSIFQAAALAPEPASSHFAPISAKVMKWAAHVLDPYRDQAPANSLGFLLAKIARLTGWAAVIPGIFSTVVEYSIGVVWLSHVKDYLPVEWFQWGPLWIIGPLYVLLLALGWAGIFRLVEFRDPNRHSHFWTRFWVYASYAPLAFPPLHVFSFSIIVASMAVGVYHFIGAYRAFQREIVPLPEEDEESRGVMLARAILSAKKNHQNIYLPVLDFDDLSAYGGRWGYHGHDIVNHILWHHFWGPGGIIREQFPSEVAMGNVGGDETYLSFPISDGDSNEELEATREKLEVLRATLKSRSAALFAELVLALKTDDSSARLPSVFQDIPEEWINALKSAIRENPRIPPLTFSGSVLSFRKLEDANFEKLKDVDKMRPRELFTYLRAALTGPLDEAKENKRNGADSIQHIRTVTDYSLPTIRNLENLFSPKLNSLLTRPEKEYVALRDPRRPVPRMRKNLHQVRKYDKWVKQVQDGHDRGQNVILGSIRHGYGGPGLKNTLLKMMEVEHVRSVTLWRGGLKALNKLEQTLSLPDLVIALERLLFSKIINAELKGLGGHVHITVHRSVTDTFYFEWVPPKNSTTINFLEEFQKVMARVLMKYEDHLTGALAMSTPESNGERLGISVIPQIALLLTDSPAEELKQLTLRKIQDLIEDSHREASQDEKPMQKLFSHANPIFGQVEHLGKSLHYIKMAAIDHVTEDMEKAFKVFEANRQSSAQEVLRERILGENLANEEYAEPHYIEMDEAA